jgi:hypothetical protein
LVIDGCLTLKRVQATPNQPAPQISLQILQHKDGVEQWSNPAGIDAAITRMFPDPIFVGAMENATEDVGKYATGTTIGKLIKEIIGPVAERNAGPVSEALAQVALRLSADGSEKDEALVDLDQRIGIELGRIFPGVVAKTHIQTPEFGDFLKSATIKIYDQKFHQGPGRDASSFGHGAQRSVQIALIKCLSEIKRQAGDLSRTTLLLIDEPELYLHPPAIEMVRASLSRLSKEGYQVVFTTHSANMISRQDAPNALLIRWASEEGTTCYARLVDAVKTAIEGAAHQSEVLFSLANSSKVLFSERVVLAEGKTEQCLIPDIFFHEFGCSLEEEDKLGLVSVGGANNIPNALSVLTAMGIPTKAVVDLDFAFGPALQQKLIEVNNPAVEGCISICRRMSDEGRIEIGNGGLPTRSQQLTAGQAFELLAQETDAVDHIRAIHQHLLGKGIWVWKLGTIETCLGLSAKTPAAHLRFLGQYPDPEFRAGLPHLEEFRAMLRWLRQ